MDGPTVTFQFLRVLRRAFLHSFIHLGYFYSASSIHYHSEALPTQHKILCRSFTPKRHR